MKEITDPSRKLNSEEDLYSASTLLYSEGEYSNIEAEYLNPWLAQNKKKSKKSTLSESQKFLFSDLWLRNKLSLEVSGQIRDDNDSSDIKSFDLKV